MRTRKLGAQEVSELGFGILSFASTYGQAPEKAESSDQSHLTRVFRQTVGVSPGAWRRAVSDSKRVS
jgi:AraC-like DNA-binding protein